MAAPQNNRFAVGNNGGRPRMYATVDEMLKVIDEYFKHIKGSTGSAKTGEEMRLPEPATITGLTLYLGFSDRGSLSDYEKKEEFTHIIKRARLRVESEYERNLHGNNTTGSIFALKNMGWRDKQEVEHSGEVDVIQIIKLPDNGRGNTPESSEPVQ